MKSVTALCILAALCAIQTNASDSLKEIKNEIQTAKNNLALQISGLRFKENSLVSSAKKRIDNLKIQYMTDLNNAVNSKLNAIRVEVDAANANGKDAESCYTNALESMTIIYQDSFSKLENCESVVLKSLYALFNKFHELEKTGNELLSELDRVLLNCESSDVSETRKCTTDKLEAIDSKVKKFKENVNNETGDVDSAGDDAVAEAISCYTTVLSAARVEASDVALTSNTCVKNV